MTPPKPRAHARSSGPATKAVVSKLRDNIVSGRYKAGDWLPTERSLAEELGVDRRVVRAAVNHLVQSGLAIQRPHCRPIVGNMDSAALAPATAPVAPLATVPPPSANFMALLMCHGSELMERAFNSQQRIFWGMNQVLAQAGHHAVFLDLKVVASEHMGAYDLRTITVGTPPADAQPLNFDVKAPALFYSRPKDAYKGNDAKKIMLDFYLANTTLAPDGNKVRATINGAEFMLDRWLPYMMEGLPAGQATIKLELVDNSGTLIPGPYNSVTRTISVEP